MPVKIVILRQDVHKKFQSKFATIKSNTFCSLTKYSLLELVVTLTFSNFIFK